MDGGDSFTEVDQHEALVHEVERSLGQVVLDDVVPANLHIGRAQALLQPPDIEVGGQDVPGRSDSLGHPSRDRSPARPDVEAPPSVGYPEAHQVTDRDRVKQRGQRVEPVSGLGCFVFEEIVGVAHGSLAASSMANSLAHEIGGWNGGPPPPGRTHNSAFRPWISHTGQLSAKCQTAAECLL